MINKNNAVVIVDMPGYKRKCEAFVLEHPGVDGIFEEILYGVFPSIVNEKSAKRDILAKINLLSSKLPTQVGTKEHSELLSFLKESVTDVHVHLLSHYLYSKGLFGYRAISIKNGDVIFLREDLYLAVLKLEASQCAL